MGRSIRVARSSPGAQVRVHREHGGRPVHPERAPGHTELALIDGGARVDLDLIVDLPHRGPKLKRHPLPDVSAAQIIAGYRQIIAQAHGAGLKIFGGRLTPFKGAGYYSDAGRRSARP